MKFFGALFGKWNLFGFRMSKSLRYMVLAMGGMLFLMGAGAFTAYFFLWDKTPYGRQLQGFLGAPVAEISAYLKTNGFTHICTGTICTFELAVPKHRSHTAKMVSGSFEITAADNTVGAITTTEFCHADNDVTLKLGCKNR